jgi:hypothetical protein
MRMKLALIIVILAALHISRAFCQTLLTQANLAWSFHNAGIADSLSLEIHIEPGAVLFDGLYVHSGDVGNTYSIGSGNDPDFVSFVTQLTDGNVSLMSYMYAEAIVRGGSSGLPEADFFTALPPNNNGIDLGGFTIDHFSLRFDALELISPGIDPNGDGFWTDGSFSATFSVYGQPIPEPCSLPIFCFGVVAMCVKIMKPRMPVK